MITFRANEKILHNKFCIGEWTMEKKKRILVITAAVAAMMGEGNGFTVRRVRRVTNTPAWAKAGREEQIYSRY